MSYKHFGRIGDIWKHVPLAEFLRIEKPNVFIESNSASSLYNLSKTPEQQYGIYHFFNNCKSSKTLFNSAYYKTITYFNPDSLKVYPGSSLIAFRILESSDCKHIIYDINEESLNNVLQYAKENNMHEKSVFINADSINGINKTIDNFDSNTFIHFDPYDSFTPNEDGICYLDVFLNASDRGIKAMLWYGFMTLDDKNEILEILHNKINLLPNKNISCVEIYMKSIQKDTVVINPGIVGCGIITCNLSDTSNGIMSEIGKEIVKIYKGSIILDKFPGDIGIDYLKFK